MSMKNAKGFPAIPIQERFWLHVTKTDSCWIWNGSRVWNGYGRTTINRKAESANRVAWFLTHGVMPPKELHVCHHCDNPPCVNPAHLFLGTRSDNMKDASRKRHLTAQAHPESHNVNQPWFQEIRKRKKTVCRQGHPLVAGNIIERPNGKRRCLTCVNAYKPQKAVLDQKRHASERCDDERR